MRVNAGRLRMVDLNGLMFLILLLSSSFLVVKASEPSCERISDFGKCMGTTTNFCPNNVECACKDEKPFCSRCPNYRGPWGDYWYMGSKCEHLWNTLDLVLVIVFPSIALASMAGVTVQWIYFCKNKSKHHTKNDSARQLARSEIPVPKLNPVYAPEPRVNLKSQQSKKDVTPSHLPMHRIASHTTEPERYTSPWSAVPENNFSASPYQPTIFPHIPKKPNVRHNPYSQNHQFAYDNQVMPTIDYNGEGMEDPIPSATRKPRPKFAVPVFPQSDYELNAASSIDYAQLSARPYGIGGRPQIRNQYGY